MKSMEQRIEELRRRRAEVEGGGGAERIEKQQKSGKLTARDQNFPPLRSKFISGSGIICRAPFHVVWDAGKSVSSRRRGDWSGNCIRQADSSGQPGFYRGRRVSGRSAFDKVAESMEQAMKTGTPFVFINDSGGARVQEGIDSLSGYGKVFFQNVMLSGVVPQISLICGPCAGGAAYSPALTDFIIQTRKAQMFITGPNVIKQVTGEDVTAEQLGGADAHMATPG